ncbi:hypothetical protein BKH46_04505 [Helicobacter sp. 12S02634-8]|nr:hypothetical protein BKH46_04505 [Helicobacter sp. 12S02634-8]
MFVLLISNLAYAFEITINYGKENSKNFSVLNLKHSKPFLCQIRSMTAEKPMVECVIDAIPAEGFTPTKTIFFDFYYQMIDQKFHLYIKPKKNLKLYPIPHDLKPPIPLIQDRPQYAQAWQIIGYEDQIPFLSHQQSKGLNFPILIEDAQTPYIPELDINNKPLHYAKGADFEAYMKIKALIKNKSYFEAINAINETLRHYPDTLFKKDLYFYQIIALSNIDPKEQDATIELATHWIKQYPDDPAIPQVLYLLAKAYAGIFYYSESQHYYKRIIAEYPQDRYAPLAKMQLAIEFSGSGDIGLAAILFQEAYAQAKDLPSASEIALAWAEFEVKKQNNANAIELINKVLKVYPQFFALDPKRTDEAINFFSKHHLLKSAAAIAQSLLDHTKEPQVQEQIGYVLGDLYAKAGEFDKAHQANLNYIATQPPMHKEKEVKSRDDAILFDLSGSDTEKLKRYDYIIQKYPRTQEALKAQTLKAELLLTNKQYTQVLQMRDSLPQNSPSVQKALNALIKEHLKNNDCKNANIYLVQTTQYDLTTEERLKAFDCLYSASLNKNAQIIATHMAKEAKTPEQKLPWLYRDGKNFYQLGDYKTSLLAAQDAFSLAIASKKPAYYDIGFIVFADLAYLKNKQEALKISAKLQELLPNDPKMIKVYATLLEWETQAKNDTTIQIYAKNIIALQERYQLNTYTPYAEFELINALIRTHNPQEALTQTNALLHKNLTDEQKQKALYTKASIQNLQNNPQEAQKSFEQCLNIQAEGPWKNLCTQGLELLKQ